MEQLLSFHIPTIEQWRCYSTFWSGVAGLSARGGRADKPQHHSKRWNKMVITVDWSLLGNLRAREGDAVKFFQIRQVTLVSARVKLGETVPRDFVEDQRRGRISWENSYSKKLPALTSLRTLVELRSLRKPRVR